MEEEEKTLVEAAVLSLFDLAIASTCGIAADILAAAVTIADVASGQVRLDDVKIKNIPAKGDVICMCKTSVDYSVKRNFVTDKIKEERKCVGKKISRRF